MIIQSCAKYLEKIQLENSSELVILPTPIYKTVSEFQGACGPSHSFVVRERGLEYKNFLFGDELS